MAQIEARPLKRGERVAVTVTDADGTVWGVVCGWFAGCGRDAETTVPHPILGDVPTCARCAKLARQ